MECKKSANKAFCNCSYEPCSRKGVCCDCLQYHLKSRQCPPAASRTTSNGLMTDRSLDLPNSSTKVRYNCLVFSVRFSVFGRCYRIRVKLPMEQKLPLITEDGRILKTLPNTEHRKPKTFTMIELATVANFSNIVLLRLWRRSGITLDCWSGDVISR